MSELLREMETNVNPRKWRENHGGWVGNKRTQFPSQLDLFLSTERKDKEE